MSTELPPSLPVASHSPQWTPNGVFGLLCLVLACIMPWVVGDPDAGRGMGTALTVLGGMLLGISPALPVPGTSRGNASVGFLVVAAVAGALALGLGGCGATQVKADDTVDVDVWTGPPCRAQLRADGEIVMTVTSKNLTKKCNFVVDPVVTP